MLDVQEQEQRGQQRGHHKTTTNARMHFVRYGTAKPQQSGLLLIGLLLIDHQSARIKHFTDAAVSDDPVGAASRSIAADDRSSGMCQPKDQVRDCRSSGPALAGPPLSSTSCRLCSAALLMTRLPRRESSSSGGTHTATQRVRRPVTSACTVLGFMLALLACIAAALFACITAHGRCCHIHRA